MPLLFLFIVMPIVEMWVLIEVGAVIGALPTIGLVLLTAMIGLALLRRQGISTLTRANRRMEAGELPAQEMVEGIFLAVGGALLLTPGFITDAIGMSCLIPGLRQLVIGRLLKGLVFRATVINSGYGPGRGQRQGPHQSHNQGDIIDGEFRRHDPSSDRDRLP
ncbi:FxsA family protein [Pseudomaricurvus alkylphenolicus]|jgi:UPF0716 protein FxsA|uniref:FxsA family protein n=1 Tax=Pseudomaricurvus alkylphenolicus TaxID=1306991 RepID=UPI0014227160|nr:FxsA family protein [Pseudomaricurvus alkylphenolicus]NIB40008.1 FxsA family protein [Pseudomaricurvus alkylphenolicus]